MAKKPAIIFDLDGTLIDISERHYAVYEKLIGQFGGVPLDRAEYWHLKRNKTAWPELLGKSSISQNRHGDFLEQFVDQIEDPAELSRDTFLPNALETLRELSGYPKYLISLRRHEDRLITQLKRLGLHDYFDKVITGHTEGEGFELKVRLIRSIAVEAGYMIGDTEADIKAAQVLGLKSVAVLSGIRSEAYLRSLGPDYIISGVADLPKIVAE